MRMEKPSGSRAETADVVVVGAGHNGLVAATFLARAGLRVHVVEDQPVIGGATRTEKPFKHAPELGTSTGAYLLGLMPPELIQKLGVDIPVLRRDPHYFLPTTGDRHLLLGSDGAKNRASLESFFSKADADANDAMQKEIGEIRDDIAPTWLEEPLSIEETAEKYVRSTHKKVFIDLCRKPVGDYISRFDFKSDLVRAMYAVTDGFSGLFGSWDTPGTGMNFLVHNMCRLPNAGGTWMIVKGGMGTVSGAFADAAKRAGATFEIGNGVEKILRNGNAASGVRLKNGNEIRAKTVVVNADPFRMQTMLGRDHLPAEYNNRIDGYRKDGSTMKVNMALKGLPKFKCLPEDRGQFQTTIHLLPEEKDVIEGLRRGFHDVKQGKLAEFPTIEWYIHTTVDPSLQDEARHHNSALFVQWVPYEIAGSSWEAEEENYVRHLLSICDRFAPGTSDLVVDTFPLHPQKIETHFGISRGHIHHVDNAFGFADRLPYATPVDGVYSCSAGCHPAGSVIGAAGHNAAMRVLDDLGKKMIS
jgi:phytoene dehydrogenase-like protein